MKPHLIRRGLVGFLLLLGIFNVYKSTSFYAHPDYPYDARNVFIAGKLWLKGNNPYNDSLIKSEWNQTSSQNGLISEKPPGFPDCGMIYPFWSIPALIPYFFPSFILQETNDWNFSRIFIWLLSLGFIFGIAWFGSKNFIQYSASFGSMLLLILSFKSGAVALMLGQPLLYSLFSLMISWYFYLKKNDNVSGLFFGLAMVKVSICVPFIFYFLTLKKWKLLLYSGAVPLVSAAIFYLVAGDLYISEMLANITAQMQINYAGDKLTAVNTNLTELGILANYFLGIGYHTISKVNNVLMLLGSLVIIWSYVKGFIKQEALLALLIVWQFLFSYHLIYDCMLLLFIIPVIYSSRLPCFGWILILSPLFLPINGIFKNSDILQFHLPITVLALLLYIVYDCYAHYRKRII